MATDTKKASAVEMFGSLLPKFSRGELKKLQGLIGDELQARDDESHMNKTPGEMTDREFAKWSNIEIAKGDDR